ncbi:MarR family winged helix-turn-helix transcriptional regulator [Marinactinospora rubrisoli]|uniref:MarR family winged helix-turn-helix transcriptional regulator n=1 Tax=Marinactinospora rubrisoli TaxID=2715399 RepID=A0ABW2KH92_9ACTN
MFVNRPGLALAFSGQIAHARIRKALAGHGLRTGHGNVLLLLAERGPTSQQSLAETIGVDPSVLVAILNDLEGDGLAERRRDPADRRRHIVGISADGRRLAADLHGALADVEADLFADLAPGEVADLQRLLGRVRADGGGTGACAGD